MFDEETIFDRLVPRFVITVTINECAHPFPSPAGERVSFTRKQYAKRYCAYLAVTWLIEHGHMPDDGSVRFRKPTPASVLGTTMLAPNSGCGVSQLVDQLCKKLGFSPVKYIIEPMSYGVFSGHAIFPQEPLIDGKLGVFENIFGRRNAKEVCAAGVLEHLRAIERQRAEQRV